MQIPFPVPGEFHLMYHRSFARAFHNRFHMPKLQVDQLDPAELSFAGGVKTVTVRGSGFVGGNVTGLRIGAAGNFMTTVVSPNLATIDVDPVASVAAPGIAVATPTPGSAGGPDGTSLPFLFTP